MLYKNSFISTGERRGPQWATAQECLALIPELQSVIKGHHTASNFLSFEYRQERVKRRNRNPMKEYRSRGRTPLYEYNVASVRRRVKELLGR